jgi:hypothetical protein
MINNLLFILTTQIEYILGNLLILASLIIEELVIAIITPSGFFALISSVIFLELLIAESIIKDVKAISFRKNIIAMPGCNILSITTASLHKA